MSGNGEVWRRYFHINSRQRMNEPRPARQAATKAERNRRDARRAHELLAEARELKEELGGA